MACVDSSNDSYFKSLERVHNYPIVNDSLVLVLSYYQWLKSKNTIIDHTLARAEGTMKSLKDTAQPIFVNKLGFIDNTIYNQLERFEKTCPIILEPSSTITNIPRRVYHNTLHPALQTAMSPIIKTIDTLTPNTIKSTMSSLVESSINSTNFVLDRTDELLDKYLPGIEDSLSEDPLENRDIYLKVKRLSAKSKQRLYKRASNKVTILTKSSMDRLEQIQSVIREIQLKRNAIQTRINQEYSKTVSLIKDNLPEIPAKYSQFIRESQNHFINLHKLISSSAGSTVDYLLNNALDGLNGLNGSLHKLLNVLSKSKPEFISESVVNHTNDIINEIRIGLDSFVHNMKDTLTKRIHEEEMTEMKEYEST